MKKIVFAILLSMLTLSSFAQKDSLYVDGMTWITGHFSFAKDTIDEVYPVRNKFIIDGDSVIGGVKYKKLLDFYSCNWVEDDCYITDLHDGTYLCRYEDGKYLFYLPNRKSQTTEGYDMGNECVFFDENLKPGNTYLENLYGKIAYIADTIFDCVPEPRRFWKLQPDESTSLRYHYLLDYVMWVDGIGSLSQPIPYFFNEYDCTCYNALLYCINPAGDTIYRNQKYIDLVEPYFKTDIPVLKSSNVSFSQRDDECVVALPYASAWSATLYNSSGVTVARCSGEGDEIILPATSKGTNILVLNIVGRVVKKKVFIK